MEKGGGQKGREMYLSSGLSTAKCEIQMRNNCWVEQSRVQGDQSGLSISTVLTKSPNKMEKMGGGGIERITKNLNHNLQTLGCWIDC